MEYVEGTDLARLVGKQGPLPVAQACDYIRQAAHGLQHAHERGLVHRDIKPANLLIADCGLRIADSSGQSAIRNQQSAIVKVLDLGLARLRRPAPEGAEAGKPPDDGVTSPLTVIGAVMMGTPDYLAPEQALNFHEADIRADIYSLGCSFYFVLTGAAPFAAFSMPQKLLQHQQAEPPDVRQGRPDVPVEVVEILGRMLAKRPEQRYQHPSEVAAALTAVLASLPGEGGGIRAAVRRSRLAVSRTVRAVRKWRGLIGAAVALLVVIATAAAVPFLLMDRFRRAEGPTVTDETPGTNPEPPGRAITEERVWTVGAPVTSAAVSRDHVIAAATGDSVRLWDAVARAELRPPLAHPKKVNAVAFSPNGKILATGCDDHLVRLWSLKAEAPTELRGQTVAVTSLAFSPDGKTLASGGDDRTLVIWDLDKRKLVSRLHAKAGRKLKISSVVFDPEGKVLACCDPGVIWLWSWRNRELLRSVGNLTGASVVRFTPDGLKLAAGSAERVKMMQVPSLKAIPARNKSDTGFRALAFSPDGLRLASGGPDGVVRFWDVVSFQPLTHWKAHDATIIEITYSADRTYLMTASEDGTVKLWLPGKHGRTPAP
jgi:hypothetical protein